MSFLSPIRRLIRYRRAWRELIGKLDYIVEVVTDTRHRTNGLTKQLGSFGAQNEILRQMAAIQDHLVRREIAEKHRASRPDLGSQLATRIEALSAETIKNRSALDELAASLRAFHTKAVSSGDELRALVSEVGKVVQHDHELLRAQIMVMPSWLADVKAGDRVRSTLRHLRPFALRQHSKVRLGRSFDGGYVTIDDFHEIEAALSLGVNDDVSWDRQIADRGIPVFQYDHTISGLPEQHDAFHFASLKVGFETKAGCISLTDVIKQRLAAGQSRLILKMDIEGDEWDALDHIEPDALAHCAQLICEFHHLERLAEPEFGQRADRVLEHLARRFFVCHVHGNNCGNLAVVGNVPVPESLEVTFANRDIYEAVATDETFPTPIDMPNQEGRADLFLGTFRF